MRGVDLDTELSHSWDMDPAVVVALITGLVSLLVAVFSVTFTAHVQTKTAVDKAATDVRLTQLNASLTQQRDEEAARRDYTYDARKRLYAEVNPLLFSLRELCEGSSWRVRRIVSENILVCSGNRVRTTAQRLAAPLVVAQEIQRHMTAVDLRVDPITKAQYIVSRELLWNLHEGKKIAKVDPLIPYVGEGASYEPRQHLTFAQLQRLVDAFTKPEENGTKSGTRRPLKLSELEDQKADEDIADVLHRMATLFASASASSTPVLWRLLIAQVSLMHVFVDLVDRDSATVNGVLPPDIRAFEWQPETDPSFESQVGAVEMYLRERLSRSGLALAPASRLPPRSRPSTISTSTAASPAST
jgi:hypothetical protein